MAMNNIVIDSYSKNLALATTPENVVDSSGGAKYKYALDVVLYCPSANTSNILVGNRTRQGFEIVKGQSIRMTTMMNRMSQSSKFLLEEIFIKVGTNNDDVQVLLIGPSNDDAE